MDINVQEWKEFVVERIFDSIYKAKAHTKEEVMEDIDKEVKEDFITEAKVKSEAEKEELARLFFASTNYLKMQRHFPKVAAGNSSKLHKLPGAC